MGHDTQEITPCLKPGAKFHRRNPKTTNINRTLPIMAKLTIKVPGGTRIPMISHQENNNHIHANMMPYKKMQVHNYSSTSTC